MLDRRASWVDSDSQKPARNKKERRGGEAGDTPVGEIKKKKKRCARREKDADLFAEYVYVKGEPGWTGEGGGGGGRKKRTGRTANCLTSSALPRVVFSPRLHGPRGVRTHAHVCVPTRAVAMERFVLQVFTLSFKQTKK